MFSIIKKTANVWHHISDTQTVHLSTFGVVADITEQTFILRALNGAFFPRQAVLFNEIQVIDETDSGTIETFNNIDELIARLIQLQYPPYKTSGGGGGGAVDSVNGQTGVVVLDADDISDASTAKKFVSASEKTAITHANRSILDAITEAFTTALKSAYDGAVAWIVANGANLLNHLTNTSNPHSTTATQVGAYTTGQVDTLLSGKENTIPAGTTSQYYRGDKTFQTLDKSAVGLGNVDNTSDLNKPISTATQTALNGKITQNDWVDISLTSTISGFSTITTRTIEYLVTGDECTLMANVQGTSNSAVLTFTLPFNYTGLSNFIDLSARIVSNGTPQNFGGMVRIIPNTNLVEVFINGNATGFATTGNKQAQLVIKFKIN